MHTKPLITVLVLVCLYAHPPAASAAECGASGPRGAGTLKGTLTLDDEASTVRRDFRRGGGVRRLQLVFEVVNCELNVPPKVSRGPLKDVDNEIPRQAFGRPRVEALGDEVKIAFTVSASKLDPGTYGSLIEVSDPERLTTARTPVTLSRSEPSMLVPGAIGLLAGGIGFLVFYVGKWIAGQRLVARKQVLWVVAVLAFGAGAVVAIFNWLDQDVWVWQDNWKTAAATAFTQSSAIMVALIGGAFSERATAEPAAAADHHDPALREAAFWKKVFDALPPAFIKAARVSGNELTEAEHITENAAFRAFQGENLPGDRTDAERQLIIGDHQCGDEIAIAAGRSSQIESSDTYGMNSSRQIITFKHKIEHGEGTYIAGWYMPIDLPPHAADSDEMVVRALGQQPVFRVVRAAPGGDTFKIAVGEASRRAARAAGG